MVEKILITQETGIVSGAIDEAVFGQKTTDLAEKLKSIKAEKAEHLAAFESLQKQEKAIEDYLADAAKITEIVKRMKIRESEGIQ